MPKLLLLRHLKSQWNLDDRYAGWTDGPLAKGQDRLAEDLAKQVFSYKIDKVYSSALFRNMVTVSDIFKFNPERYPLFIHLDDNPLKSKGNFTDVDGNDMPVYVTNALNERYYGKLQGLNKQETIKKFGEEKVRLWRRSYKVAPPGGESLRDVCKRTDAFYKKYPAKDLKKGFNVLIVASHNTLRAIVKNIEKISNEDIAKVELPFAGLLQYDFDEKMRLLSNKYFI